MSSQQIKKLSRSGGGGLKKVAGGPDIANINSINEAAKNAEAGNNYVVTNPVSQSSNEFPYVPFARDDYDDVANIKRQFQQGGAKAVVTLDKDDANYALRQRAQVENADFDRWVMLKYDLADPAQNFMMQQIAPDQFQRRLDLIEAQQSLVSKYARLRLMGPKKLDDLKFEWMVETGRVQLPKGPIWDPVAWMSMNLGHGLTTDEERLQRKTANTRRFQAGLFNPIRYLTERQVGWGPDLTNRSDIRGNPNTVVNTNLFAGSRARSPYQQWGRNPMWGDGEVVTYNDVMPGVRAGELVRGEDYIRGPDELRDENEISQDRYYANN